MKHIYYGILQKGKKFLEVMPKNIIKKKITQNITWGHMKRLPQPSTKSFVSGFYSVVFLKPIFKNFTGLDSGPFILQTPYWRKAYQGAHFEKIMTFSPLTVTDIWLIVIQICPPAAWTPALSRVNNKTAFNDSNKHIQPLGNCTDLHMIRV